VAVERLAELLAQLPMMEIQGAIGAHFGEHGHAFNDFGEGRQTANIAHHQRGHYPLAQAAQGALQIVIAGNGTLRSRSRCRVAVEEIVHLLDAERLHGVRVQPGRDFGSGGEQIAQVMAVPLCCL
jgi:hypothetical protein